METDISFGIFEKEKIIIIFLETKLWEKVVSNRSEID